MESSIAALLSMAAIPFFGRPRFDLVVVEPFPFWSCRIWPISVASSTPMNLLMALALKPGHPRRKPLFAAAINVVFGCEPRLAW